MPTKLTNCQNIAFGLPVISVSSCVIGLTILNSIAYFNFGLRERFSVTILATFFLVYRVGQKRGIFLNR